jgi:hypothetical protein
LFEPLLPVALFPLFHFVELFDHSKPEIKSGQFDQKFVDELQHIYISLQGKLMVGGANKKVFHS